MATIHLPVEETGPAGAGHIDLDDGRSLRSEPTKRADGRDEVGLGFLAMAVHELRGPVTILVGCGETLDGLWGRPELEQHGPQLVSTMLASGRRLRRLVNDLLTTAYLERGTLKLGIEPVPLLPILGWARDGVGAIGEAVAISCSPELCAMADADRVEQILVNLVANAVQHGAPPWSITAGPVHGTEDVEVLVRDGGPGIRPEDAPQLFEPFSPLSSHSPTSTGLGLSIARTLARAMGGDLTYEDGGDGAAFRLRLRMPDVRHPTSIG